MANLILFISPAKLKKETALGGSVDDEILQPYIRLAQEMHILPVLGQSLYDDLRNQGRSRDHYRRRRDLDGRLYRPGPRAVGFL